MSSNQSIYFAPRAVALRRGLRALGGLQIHLYVVYVPQAQVLRLRPVLEGYGVCIFRYNSEVAANLAGLGAASLQDGQSSLTQYVIPSWQRVHGLNQWKRQYLTHETCCDAATTAVPQRCEPRSAGCDAAMEQVEKEKQKGSSCQRRNSERLDWPESTQEFDCNSTRLNM